MLRCWALLYEINFSLNSSLDYGIFCGGISSVLFRITWLLNRAGLCHSYGIILSLSIASIFDLNCLLLENNITTTTKVKTSKCYLR